MHAADTSLAVLMQALTRSEGEVASFFGSLSPDEFALRMNDAWTPAEHVEHLSIAVNAVARGFSMPQWLLRLRFGTARRPSRTFEQLRDDYRARLTAGGRATGRFVPGREDLTIEQRARRQTEILARWGRANGRLRAALDGWTERDLDRVRLPHPLLGTITAREMLFFTIYHAPHHVAAARTRLPGFMPDTAPGTDQG